MNNYNNGQGDRQYNPNKSGGRPKSDADYGTKKKGGKKPQNAGRGGRDHRGGGKFGGGGNRGGGRPQMELFRTTCSTCQKSCEVPFKPDGSKPVLCSECFGKNKTDSRGGFNRNDRPSFDRPKRDFDAPRRESVPSPDYKTLLNQVSNLEGKVAEILEILKDSQKKTVSVEVATVEKKTAVKKVASKKAVEKKVEATPKKVVMKKVAVKKTPAKKVATKKPVTKKIAKTVTKKPVVKKAVVKKVVKK